MGKQEIQNAVEFAVRAHAGQFRKTNRLPYIVHPMAVLSQIAEWDVTNETTRKAALCHDILEDCPAVTYSALIEAIGEEAAKVVEELTFRYDTTITVPKNAQKDVYRQSFLKKSVQALVIKCADGICNTCDFLCTDPDYAAIYWKRCSPVFMAALQRQNEITGCFGESVFPRLMHTKMTVMSMITG